MFATFDIIVTFSDVQDKPSNEPDSRSEMLATSSNEPDSRSEIPATTANVPVIEKKMHQDPFYEFIDTLEQLESTERVKCKLIIKFQFVLLHVLFLPKFRCGFVIK